MKLWHVCMVVLLTSVLYCQHLSNAPTPVPAEQERIAFSEKAASPEMARLAGLLAGDWDTVETMEHGISFPNGGSRHGVVHARLAAGGTTLVYEVHSDGSAGVLDGFLSIW